MRSANYTGDGTTAYNGYNVYDNFTRYYVYDIAPSITLSTDQSVLRRYIENDFGAVDINVKVLAGSTVIREYDESIDLGKVKSIGTKTVTNTDGFTSITIEVNQLTVYGGTEGDASTPWYYYGFSMSSCDVTFSAPVTYSGNGDLKIQTTLRLRVEDIVYTDGHTVTVTDTNGNYL